MMCFLIGFDVSHDLSECRFKEFRMTRSRFRFTGTACFDIVDGGFRNVRNVGNFIQ